MKILFALTAAGLLAGCAVGVPVSTVSERPMGYSSYADYRPTADDIDFCRPGYRYERREHLCYPVSSGRGYGSRVDVGVGLGLYSNDRHGYDRYDDRYDRDRYSYDGGSGGRGTGYYDSFYGNGSNNDRPSSSRSVRSEPRRDWEDRPSSRRTYVAPSSSQRERWSESPSSRRSGSTSSGGRGTGYYDSFYGNGSNNDRPSSSRSVRSEPRRDSERPSASRRYDSPRATRQSTSRSDGDRPRRSGRPPSSSRDR
ncbi:MAG TPA: hypothetical protein VGB97_03880 [Candidatus Paceibacterota bacterium]|jgi:hypothetical protein